MKKIKLFLSLMIVAALFAVYSCGGGKAKNVETSDTAEVVQSSEFELLIKYIEENGDFINSKAAPALITAKDLKAAFETEDVKIVDIRKAKDFAAGQIEGAVNVKMANLLDHIANEEIKSADKVVITCYSGQSASYSATILRLLGHNNVFALKFGMSSWNKKFAEDKWLAKASNKYAEQLETDANPKPTAGNYPKLSTGLTTGKEILKARAKKVLEAGFSGVLVSADDLMSMTEGYFVINYWPESMYNLGHVPTAIQYTPKKDLNSKTALNTLPTDMPIMTYCHTGQNAASITAFLRVLGYDAQSLSYGANALMNKTMLENVEIGKGFSEKMVENFPTITSEYIDGGLDDEEDSGC